MMKRMGKEMGDEFNGPEFAKRSRKWSAAVIWAMTDRPTTMSSG